jgi:hypothetical protein
MLVLPVSMSFFNYRDISADQVFLHWVIQLILLIAQNVSTLKSDFVWYLDIGAITNMISHKHLFAKMTKLDGTVLFGYAFKVEVK